MKLAMVTPDAVAHCFLCQWQYRAPLRKRKKSGEKEELSLQDRSKVIETNVLYHLREVHGKMLLTKEEFSPTEEGLLGKTYYNGSRFVRFK